MHGVGVDERDRLGLYFLVKTECCVFVVERAVPSTKGLKGNFKASACF